MDHGLFLVKSEAKLVSNIKTGNGIEVGIGIDTYSKSSPIMVPSCYGRCLKRRLGLRPMLANYFQLLRYLAITVGQSKNSFKQQKSKLM